MCTFVQRCGRVGVAEESSSLHATNLSGNGTRRKTSRLCLAEMRDKNKAPRWMEHVAGLQRLTSPSGVAGRTYGRRVGWVRARSKVGLKESKKYDFPRKRGSGRRTQLLPKSTPGALLPAVDARDTLQRNEPAARDFHWWEQIKKIRRCYGHRVFAGRARKHPAPAPRPARKPGSCTSSFLCARVGVGRSKTREIRQSA